ncbi:hypothetical protein GCM10027456_15540 [Kineosporia babensis]
MPTITAIEISMSFGRVLSDLRRCSALRSAAEPTTCAAGPAGVLGVSVTSLWLRLGWVNA